MLRRVTLALLLTVGLASSAYAQVVPSGSFTTGHTVRCQNTKCTVAVDAGGAAGSDKQGQGYLTELGITNTGTPLCVTDALTNATAGYHQLCIGANALGGGLISYNAYGGASPLGLQTIVNGVVIPVAGSITGLPSVVDNSALSALPSSFATAVMRLDYSIGLGAPTVVYRSSTSPCSLNSGAGDGGSQVPTSNSGCWLATFGPSYDVRVWGAKDDDGATDSVTAINAALAYASTVGGIVDLGGRGYGVCNTPVHMTGGTKRIILRNGQINLQTGCGSPPQELLLNDVAPTASYAVAPAVEDMSIDGKCVTKYVYRIHGGNQTTHKNVLVYNPAPNATINGSIGVFIDGGFEVKFGSSNWVIAAGACYNGGNLPQTGIYHTNGGNADFTGVVVVNFITGINAGGDDYFGPGTHIWGGCSLTGGGCSYDPALRTTAGIFLNGTGTAIGVEIDDPVVAGIAMVSVNAFDNMVVIGNRCVYSATPTSGQTCVTVGTGVTRSVVLGTAAANVAQAFPNNVVFPQSGVGNTTMISSNPGASQFSGDAPVINMAGAATSLGDGCIGLEGYQSGATSCTGQGWVVSPTIGCRAQSLTVALSVAAGAGNSLKFTVQDNGVDTPLTVTLSGDSAFQATQNGVWADIGAGDVITLRAQATVGTPPDTAVRANLYGCG